MLALSVAALIAAAVFAPTYDADGIPISDAIQGESNGVAGQEALGRHFDAGTGSPTVIITPEETWPEVAEAAAATDGVAAVVPFTGGPPLPGAAAGRRRRPGPAGRDARRRARTASPRSRP